MIHVGPEVIEARTLCEAVADPAAGATALFLGTVRDHHEGHRVLGLRYEAYPEMAVEQIGAMVEEARGRWPLERVAVSHRTGDLEVGAVSVAVAVSSAHRREAFEACAWIMDRVKRDAPIWKEER
ncbi:MAG: molybdenum cofactor biosynthesis protein MoaE [Planctomycetes bacterium]|nr:molybdenum cofactor biosynthesis protein MoaE [Planctomycetota bacterium]